MFVSVGWRVTRPSCKPGLHWRPQRQHTETLAWQEGGCFIGLYLLGCR